MAMTADKWEMLRRIIQRSITHAEMKTNKELRDVQELTNLGYVRDYGQWHGKRIPVNLRIWGITPAGRAVLEQQALAEHSNRGGGHTQLSLTMTQKPILTIKTGVVPRHTKSIKEPSPSEVLVERVKKEEGA